MTDITEREVIVYREIYYEHVKPMILAGKTQDEIEVCVNYMAEEFDMEPDRWRVLHRIDLLQRIASIHSDRLKVRGVENLSAVQELPELKCPRRTTQGK